MEWKVVVKKLSKLWHRKAMKCKTWRTNTRNIKDRKRRPGRRVSGSPERYLSWFVFFNRIPKIEKFRIVIYFLQFWRLESPR